MRSSKKVLQLLQNNSMNRLWHGAEMPVLSDVIYVERVYDLSFYNVYIRFGSSQNIVDAFEVSFGQPKLSECFRS